MTMNIKCILLAFMVAIPFIGQAQEDDMYFIPRKDKDNKTEQKDKTPRQVQTWVVTYAEADEPTTGAERDVDEYNRRYARRDNDTLYLDEQEKSGRDASAEYDAEEGTYGSRLMRERTLLLGIPVNSRLYWDICYGPSSFYWDIYDDGFYTYAYPTGWYYGAYPWSWYYPYGSPWGYYGYHHWGWGPGWGWGVSWYPGHWHYPIGGRPGWVSRSAYNHGVRNGHRGAWYPSRGTQAGRRPGGTTSRPGISGGQTMPGRRPARSGVGRTYGGNVTPTRPQRGTDMPSRPTNTPSRTGGYDRGGGSNRGSGSFSTPSRGGGSGSGIGGGSSRGGYGGGRRR